MGPQDVQCLMLRWNDVLFPAAGRYGRLMRSKKLVAPVALVALALLIVVIRLAAHRAPPPPPPPPALRVARDAGRAADAVADVPEAAPVDAGEARRDTGPVAPIDPRRRELENQRRDVVAAQIYRDLLQDGRRVTAVRAIDSGDGARSYLRVQGTMCDDATAREIARTYPLRQAGYTLVACTHPGTRDTFMTGVSEEASPVRGADAGPAAVQRP